MTESERIQKDKSTGFAILGVALLIMILIGAYFFSINVVGTLGLVITSLGLIIATIRLKDATDNLVSATIDMARNQILPRLSKMKHAWYDMQQLLNFEIRNTGMGTAYDVKAFGYSKAGVRFALDPPEKTADLLVGENFSYAVNLEAFREFKVDFEYTDAKGYEYKQSIIIPKPSSVQ